MAALTRHELHQYRLKLRSLLDRLTGTTAQLESEVSLPTGSEAMTSQSPAHEPIQTITEGEEEVAQTALLNEQQILAEVREALDRMDRGTFGRCDRCGRAIGKARLEAVPYVLKCILCARADHPEPA